MVPAMSPWLAQTLLLFNKQQGAMHWAFPRETTTTLTEQIEWAMDSTDVDGVSISCGVSKHTPTTEAAFKATHSFHCSTRLTMRKRREDAGGGVDDPKRASQRRRVGRSDQVSLRTGRQKLC